MNIEDKKKIIKWLGLELVKDDVGLTWIFEKNASTSGMIIEEYNPDIDPKQFKEVWDKLNDEQQRDVILELNWPENEKSLFCDYIRFGMSLALDLKNMPKIMKVVLEVIKLNNNKQKKKEKQ